MSGETRTVWQRLADARKHMSLEKSGSMKLGGSKIGYATIDDLYSTITRSLTEQDLWLNTPLEDNRVHVRVIDVRDGQSLELLSYPCVLTGRDVKADAGMWTSCKRYALTSAFNLASGDESDAERTLAKEEQRRQLGFVRKSRYASVSESTLTDIRALLVESGVTNPNDQRERVSSIINRPIARLSDLTSQAEADKVVDALSSAEGFSTPLSGKESE